MKERRLTASVLNRFRQELLRRERSAPTIEKYLHDVRTFAVWLDGREVTPEAVLAWKRELVDQFKPGTVNGKLAAVNALFALLAVLGVVADPTTKGLGDSSQALTYTAPRGDGE